jgi:hypothetical protein
VDPLSIRGRTRCISQGPGERCKSNRHHTSSASTSLFLVIFSSSHHCRPIPENSRQCWPNHLSQVPCHSEVFTRNKLMVACPPHVLTHFRHLAKSTHSLSHTHSQIRPWTQKARRRARQGGEARRSCNRSLTKSASVSGEPVRGECLPTFPKPFTQSHHMATTTKRPTPYHQAQTGRWTTSDLTKDSKTMKRRA